MKRRREQELQERARAKHARRAIKRDGPRTAGGPQIAWDEAVGVANPDASDGDAAAAAAGEPAAAVADAGGGDAPE
jgi:hypothetical protein